MYGNVLYCCILYEIEEKYFLDIIVVVYVLNIKKNYIIIIIK